MLPSNFRENLICLAVVLLTLARPVCARGAISGGPIYTNSAAALEHLSTEDYEAEQSYQEKLKVGRNRYAQKQINRAKVLASMSAVLRARQEKVTVPPVRGNDQPVDLGITPGHAVTVLSVGLLGFAVYLVWKHRPREKLKPIPTPPSVPRQRVPRLSVPANRAHLLDVSE